MDVPHYFLKELTITFISNEKRSSFCAEKTQHLLIILEDAVFFSNIEMIIQNRNNKNMYKAAAHVFA